MLITGLRKVPPDLERAAHTLGARRYRVWWHVILPLVRPSLAVAATVTFALSMTDYAMAASLGQGSRPFVANSVQSIFFSQGNTYFGAAFGTVLTSKARILGFPRADKGCPRRRSPLRDERH